MKLFSRLFSRRKGTSPTKRATPSRRKDRNKGGEDRDMGCGGSKSADAAVVSARPSPPPPHNSTAPLPQKVASPPPQQQERQQPPPPPQQRKPPKTTPGGSSTSVSSDESPPPPAAKRIPEREGNLGSSSVTAPRSNVQQQSLSPPSPPPSPGTQGRQPIAAPAPAAVASMKSAVQARRNRSTNSGSGNNNNKTAEEQRKPVLEEVLTAFSPVSEEEDVDAPPTSRRWLDDERGRAPDSGSEAISYVDAEFSTDGDSRDVGGDEDHVLCFPHAGSGAGRSACAVSSYWSANSSSAQPSADSSVNGANSSNAQSSGQWMSDGSSDNRPKRRCSLSPPGRPPREGRGRSPPPSYKLDEFEWEDPPPSSVVRERTLMSTSLRTFGSCPANLGRTDNEIAFASDERRGRGGGGGDGASGVGSRGEKRRRSFASLREESTRDGFSSAQSGGDSSGNATSLRGNLSHSNWTIATAPPAPMSVLAASALSAPRSSGGIGDRAGSRLNAPSPSALAAAFSIKGSGALAPPWELPWEETPCRKSEAKAKAANTERKEKGAGGRGRERKNNPQSVLVHPSDTSVVSDMIDSTATSWRDKQSTASLRGTARDVVSKAGSANFSKRSSTQHREGGAKHSNKPSGGGEVSSKTLGTLGSLPRSIKGDEASQISLLSDLESAKAATRSREGQVNSALEAVIDHCQTEATRGVWMSNREDQTQTLSQYQSSVGGTSASSYSIHSGLLKEIDAAVLEEQKKERWSRNDASEMVGTFELPAASTELLHVESRKSPTQANVSFREERGGRGVDISAARLSVAPAMTVTSSEKGVKVGGNAPISLRPKPRSVFVPDSATSQISRLSDMADSTGTEWKEKQKVDVALADNHLRAASDHWNKHAAKQSKHEKKSLKRQGSARQQQTKPVTDLGNEGNFVHPTQNAVDTPPAA